MDERRVLRDGTRAAPLVVPTPAQLTRCFDSIRGREHYRSGIRT